MLIRKYYDVLISGQLFSYELFQYLMSRFKEAFSHSSLTIEEAFRELDELELIINTSMDMDAQAYYSLLSSKEKREINDILHQIVVFKGARYGAFTESLTGDQKQFDRLYAQHFSYFDPYIHYFIAFDSEGKFDKSATFRKMDTLFMNLPQRNNAYHVAHNMLRDNLDAFDYSMTLKKISVSDAIRINDIVNDSDVDKVLGFKRTNNDILGAGFTPTDKKDVPFEMQKLFQEYEDNFGMTILNPNDMNITAEERYKRTCEVFRKEALFHIRFIRIHPFNDGNGRTGRIILNHHLIEQGIAPVILSGPMAQEYRDCINNYDVEGLAKLLFYSSSVQMANWVSEKKTGSVIPSKRNLPNNEQLAELLGYEETGDEGKGSKGNKSFGKKFLF